MRKLSIVLTASLFIWLLSCKKQQDKTVNLNAPAKQILHAGGSFPTVPEEHNKLINWDKLKSLRTTASSCPSSIDLSAQIPAPEDQGVQGSCVAWAVGYYIKSYWEGIENSWAFNTSSHLTSPQYLYSQTHFTMTRGGGGSNIGDAMSLLVSKGAATLDVCPYDPSDWYGFLNMPTDQMHQQAFRFRNMDWTALPLRNIDAIKTRLCNGYPVAMGGIPIYPDLDNLNFSNDTYDDLSGTRREYHAIAIIGYDDTRQAFKFINSWGPSWGLNGYGWISYNLVANNDFGSFVMYDAPNPPIAETWGSTSSSGIGTLGYYSGDVNGDGNTDVIHPWNNNGTLAIFAHDITATPTSYLVNQTMFGAGATSLGFVPADVNGDGKTDLVQGWKNGNNLALTVFTSNGSSFSRTWDGTTVSGYQNLRLLPVDYNGDGKTDIAQLWNNNGQLGIVVFRSTGSSYTLAFSTTVASGSNNIGFIPADYDGDGKTDIIQMWNNGGSLGVVVIRSSGSNYSVAWNGTMPQGSPNVGFVPVDYDGDGLMDFVQGWNNNSNLNLLLYRSNGSGYSYQTNIATRQGYQNLGLLPQRRAGQAKTGLTQVWNNNSYTAFFRYDAITY
ncbi:MAG: FG-GAP-like repeat-containing protein [Flavisolibacter sp.]